ncbi:MAG: GNAT family N-acetyltransferase [Actinobacteria bacterium]|nr:GNAT family N-acetyltransferase [Actinomycetota bacterium]
MRQALGDLPDRRPDVLRGPWRPFVHAGKGRSHPSRSSTRQALSSTAWSGTTVCGVQIRIRQAEAEDAADIAVIYAHGIRSGTATVVSRPPTPDAIIKRMGLSRPEHAWLVAERCGEVVGWAATMPYLPVDEYAGVAEFSVYVAPDCQRRGVGRLLMDALMSMSEELGLYKMTSRVFSENMASRAMLRQAGFREVGTYIRHVRFADGWRDVVIVEALLGEARMNDGG